jgi:hypothetical protein
MAQSHRSVFLSILLVVSLGTVALPRLAHAGLSDSAIALAGPLADQFGLPGSAVTNLLESGISLDSVTQLLLVSQSSGSSLDSVTKLFRDSGNDIADTAKKLEVDSADYSQEKVTAALDEAKSKAQADASEKAAESAGDAVGSALDGLKR